MVKSNSIVGIIPARFASSRFPGKPLTDIKGKPMIRWVYEQASKALKYVYVATDDQRISETVKNFGGRVVMTSEAHLSGTDRCAEAVMLAEKECGIAFDVVLNVQGDEPFIDPKQLELVMNCFDDSETQIATLVKVISTQEDMFNPNRPKVVLNNRREAVYFSRTPIPYVRAEKTANWVHAHQFYMHIGLYGFRKDVLLKITKLPQSSLELAESLEQLRWIENGYKIAARITEYEGFGIDTPEDLERLGRGDGTPISKNDVTPL
jgi:3-deoxy-manno-octulosonate cytidylyltransferase (CMP-KDO synthetase)